MPYFILGKIKSPRQKNDKSSFCRGESNRGSTQHLYLINE